MEGSNRFQPWLDKWHLVPDGAPFTTRMGSNLLPVLHQGSPAMLKLANEPEEVRGTELLEWYAGRGAVRVLAREGNAVLLERTTGTRDLAAMARGGRDDEATSTLCDVTGELHAARDRPPPANLVPLTEWFRALRVAATRDGGAFARAEPVAGALLSDPHDVVPLHGDIHHGNVLDGGTRGWLAIDPKGLVGERAFDYANLFRNPDGGIARAPGRMRRQVTVVASHATLEPVRLLQWIFAYAALGAAWSLESGRDRDAQIGLAIAQLAESELAR